MAANEWDEESEKARVFEPLVGTIAVVKKHEMSTLDETHFASDAVIAKMAELEAKLKRYEDAFKEPYGYTNDVGGFCLAADVSDTPNWSDYYYIELFTKPEGE